MTRTSRLFTAAALALSCAAPALAHGPTRVKLVLQTDVAAPPAKVWAVVGNFQDLSWDPAVVKLTGSDGNQANGVAHRSITLKSGGVIPNEELDEYDAAKMTYGTFLPHVDPKVFPVVDYSSHVVVTPTGHGGSHVALETAFYRGYPDNNPPPNLNEAAAIKAVTALWQPGLDALKAKFGAAH